VKWKLEIEMKLLGNNGIRIEIFFQNGNNTAIDDAVLLSRCLLNAVNDADVVWPEYRLFSSSAGL